MSNKLLPIADYVAFDVETTGLSPDEDRIIDIGLVRFHGGVPVERWTSLVNPGIKVGLKISRLTGISSEDLNNAPDISSLVSQIQTFRGHLPLVGHNPEFDVSFLSKVITEFPGVPVYDTLELARIVYPEFSTYKLEDLSRNLNVSLQDAHRACSDAEATGKIFGIILEKITQLTEDVRQKVVWIMGENWPAKHLFHISEVRGYQLSLFLDESVTELNVAVLDERKKMFSPSDSYNWLHDLLGKAREEIFVNIWLDDLKTPKMADELKKHAGFKKQSVLLAGKIAETEKIRNDIPFLSSSCDYLCLLKAKVVEDLARQGFLENLETEEKRFLSTVTVWKNVSHTGLFKEIQVVGKSHELRYELSCSLYPDCQHYCPFAQRCFYARAVNHAASSSLVLTANQNIFDVDWNRDACIILGFDDLGDIWERRQPRLDLNKLKDTLESLGDVQNALAVDDVIHICMSILGSKIDTLVTSNILSSLDNLYKGIIPTISHIRKKLRAEFETLIVVPLDPPVLSRALHTLEYWVQQLKGILSQSDNSTCLLEKGYGDSGYTNAVIAKREIWPGTKAKHYLSDKFKKLILFSSNVKFASNYEGLRRFYGMTPPADVFVKDAVCFTKLNKQQGPLMMCADYLGRRMSNFQHIEQVGDFLKQLSLNSCKVLCLCPSYSFIRELNANIVKTLEHNGIAVYAQGIDAGYQVVNQVSEKNSLVLARFGGDLGESTEAFPNVLVIPKIPFWPPNTMDRLRQNEISSTGKIGFTEVSVFPTVLTLRSYLEKLYHYVGNFAVAMLDPRILPGQSRWGRDFMRQLQDINIIICPHQTGLSRIISWIGTNK